MNPNPKAHSCLDSFSLSRWNKKGSRGQQKSWVAYWPSTQLVEKKQMFRVSRGLLCVNSGDRVCGSDSPVREELSTFTGRKKGWYDQEMVISPSHEGSTHGNTLTFHSSPLVLKCWFMPSKMMQMKVKNTRWIFWRSISTATVIATLK